MTKHIHIHLPKGATVTRVRSGDSDWDESKHKRDDGGKFSSTGGGGGGAKPTNALQERADKQKQAEAFNKAAAAEIKARMAARRAAAPTPSAPAPAAGGGHITNALQERADKQKQAEAANKAAVAEIKARMAARSASGWPKNEHGNPSPPVGAKVTNPNAGMAGPGTVRSVTGNVATVAYQVKGPDGKMYNRMEEFHVTKLFPAESKPASNLPQLKVRGFTATAEASPDGTFRAKLLNDDGSVHRLTATSFKTAQEAAEHAEQIALGNKK